MTKTGLITGASSGIGRALATEHARRGRDVVLVARREAELEDLAAHLRENYGITAQVYVKDLTGEGACRALYDFLAGEGIEIDYLFNNAGFGASGNFVEQEWTRISDMISLNARVVTELLHLFVPDMRARGWGRVLNSSSTAAFLPGPGQAVYFATKAYVNSLSKALASELHGTGVTVTALCPGAVDTEFAETADMAGSMLFQNAATPESTARQGYTAMEGGRLEVITDLGIQVALKAVLPFVPERLAMSVIKRIQL